MNRIWALSLGIVGIILTDQITKGVIQSHFSYGDSVVVIDGLFNLTYVRNTGGAFGLFAMADSYVRSVLFLIFPVLACLWLVWLVWTHRKKEILPGIVYSLILAGAVGNLIDRFAYGYVVDFLDFHWKNSHFPAFNVADSAISVGAFLLIVDAFLQGKKGQKTNA
ncbi:MAG: signal peptidase II [Bacteriovoracales bacterium]|nr:signal peptidase II [Bacteriovoracales bacterium]